MAPQSKLVPTNGSTVNSSSSSRKLCGWTGSLWVSGSVLKVHIMDSPERDEIKDRCLREGAHAWSQVCNIKFKFVTAAKDSDIRIMFTSDTRGSETTVGTEAKEVLEHQATMSLFISPRADEANIRYTILHEFGHALGFLHEHSSPSCSIHWNEAAVSQAYPKHEKDVLELNIYKREDAQLTFSSEFDPLSIMIYGFRPGLMLNYPEGFKQPGELSRIDREMALRVYPFPPPKKKKKRASGSVRHEKKARGSSGRRRGGGSMRREVKRPDQILLLKGQKVFKCEATHCMPSERQCDSCYARMLRAFE